MPQIPPDIILAPSSSLQARSPASVVASACGVDADVARDDAAYFRTKPARNWRIRQRRDGERSNLDGRISPDFDQLLVLRPRRSEDSDGLFFLKTDITTGVHNEAADPWVACRNGAVRASTLWKVFQVADLSIDLTEPGTGLCALLGEPALTSGFDKWLMQYSVRSLRLARVVYESVYWSIQDQKMYLDDISFGELEQLVEENEKRPHSSGYWTLVGGMNLMTRAGPRGTQVIYEVPDPESIVEDRSELVRLAYPSMLLDTATVAEVGEDTYAVLVTTAVNGTILQFGEIASDGRIGLWEVALEGLTWGDLFDKSESNASHCAIYMMQMITSKQKETTVMTQPAISKSNGHPAVATPPSPVATLLAQIQAAYDSRRQLHTARISELRIAFDTYERAAEQDLLVDFAIRNGVEGAGQLQAPAAALHLHGLIERLPELGGQDIVPARPVVIPALTAEGEVEEEDEEEGQSYPKLSALVNSNDGPLIIIGGYVVTQKLNKLQTVLDLPYPGQIKWYATDDDSKAVDRVVDAMGKGNVAAVIYLQGCMSHPQTDVILAASRKTETLCVAGGRAGTGELARALRQIEKQLP